VADVEIRALRADDDLDAQLDLSERAFGAKNASERETWHRLMDVAISSGGALAVFDDGRAVGGAVCYEMRQWWCGRPVPMAGVSGVKIAPEDRGRGIGRRIMTALLEDIAARGYPLSVLYPATMPIYRSLGWELAGGRYSMTVPSRSLWSLMPPDTAVPDASAGERARPGLRRAGPADATAVIDVLGRVHEALRDSGPVTWGPGMAAIYLGRQDRYHYLSDDGFTSYWWEDGGKLFVQSVQSATAETTRALWSVIASHGSIAESVQAWIDPSSPLWWLTAERDADIRSRRMWMLRVVDAPAAIAARGFPAAVSVTATLIINDQSRPANSGRWLLTVAGGKGELAPAGTGPGEPLILGARGLAALYAGAPVAALRQAGLAGGASDPAADAALDAAFAATPYILDAF
jgi:predicted acetyltransferase